MGIVNVTPDSFSDGGRFLAPEAAIARVRGLRAEGAEILDLGAESTRPGFTPVPAGEEWARLEPVLRALAEDGAVISVDTTKAGVARRALDAGAAIINDVWGFQADGDMAAVVADSPARAVLMHNREAADESLDLLAGWRRFFDRSLELAEKAGIPSARLILDPGIGFGKTAAQNFRAVREIGWLKREYGLPVLLGLSRKSLFGALLGRAAGERLAATIAANLEGADRGADILRVHDVRAHADALRVRAELRRAS